MKKIFIGFSFSRKLLSKIIRFATSSEISHVFIMFDDDFTGQKVVYQASGLCVNYESYSRFLTHAKVMETYSFWMTDDEWDRCRRDQLSKLGVPYSPRDLLGFIWVLVCRKFGKTVDNPLSDGDHAYICVDLAAEQLGEEWDSTMTPEDMRIWCQKNVRFTRET